MKEKKILKIFWEVKKAENRYLQRWMEIVDSTVKYLFEAPSPKQDEEVIEQRDQALSDYRRELEEIASENNLTLSELALKYNAKYLD